MMVVVMVVVVLLVVLGDVAIFVDRGITVLRPLSVAVATAVAVVDGTWWCWWRVVVVGLSAVVAKRSTHP